MFVCQLIFFCSKFSEFESKIDGEKNVFQNKFIALSLRFRVDFLFFFLILFIQNKLCKMFVARENVFRYRRPDLFHLNKKKKGILKKIVLVARGNLELKYIKLLELRECTFSFKWNKLFDKYQWKFQTVNTCFRLH
jgi:hypothetical protein